MCVCVFVCVMMMMMMQSKCRALNKKGQINREQSRRISFFFFCDRAEQRESSGSSSFVLDASSTFFFFLFCFKYLRQRLWRAWCAACERRPTRRCPSGSSLDRAACAVDVAGGPSHSIVIALRDSTCATLYFFFCCVCFRE